MSDTPFRAHPADAPALARWLLLAGGLLSLSFAFITRNTYDNGDSFMHYLIARSVWAHPLNLLHAWGKPFFTLLAAGPARVGWRGLLVGQCAVVAASAWLSYRLAARLGVPYAGLAVLFCYAAPDYFRIQFSGLTEPLFGLVLVASVYLVAAGRAGWSAAVVSWLPFVRSEGFILLGLWVVYLGWQRQWRWLPLLGLGYAAYSAVGAVVLGEPGWVFGRNPYPTVSPYGHGDWSTFLIGLLYLLGLVLATLAMLGVGSMLARLANRAAWARPLFRAELLLVYGCAAVFIGTHTVFWRFGLFGSAGLTRVLAVLTPLLAVVALRGLQLLAGWVPTAAGRRRLVAGTAAATVLFLFTGLRMAFRWQRDFCPPGEVTLAWRAARWYRQLPGPPRPIVAEQAAVQFATGIDRFDPAAFPAATRAGQPYLARLPVGTLLFWDDTFSPTQGHLPLARLVHDPQFRQRWADSTLRQPGDPGAGWPHLRIFEKVR